MGLASVGERFPKRLLTLVNIDLAFPAIQQSLAFSVVFGGGLLAVANRLAIRPCMLFLLWYRTALPGSDMRVGIGSTLCPANGAQQEVCIVARIEPLRPLYL